MLENRSLGWSVALHDNHKRAFLTGPHYRPQPRSLHAKMKQDQCDRPCGRLIHNHPSGDPTPSRADIDMTKAIVDIARPLGISVHDHIIVGKHGHSSLKGLKLI